MRMLKTGGWLYTSTCDVRKRDVGLTKIRAVKDSKGGINAGNDF